MIGALNQRASLVACAREPDGGGGATETWTAFASVWIGCEAEGGSDALGPDRDESRARYRVTLRRRGDVAAGNRIVTTDRTLLVHNILDDGPQAEFMTLLCENLP